MQNSRDILSKFQGLSIYHQKIPSREVGRHLHLEHEFFMPLQGEITVSTQDLNIKAGPGRMLYVPPNLDHSFSSSSQGSGERVIWLIDQKTWKKHIGKSYSPYSMPINSLAKELIFYLLIHQKTSGVQHFISALIESLGNSLETATLEKQNLYIDHLSGKIKDQRICAALELMDKELDSISLTTLAKQSGMSLRNFNRLF
nr:cupin domain-containing protein [Pseudobdellovibrionaceae bacterium]